jgi:hypothetical protein
MTIDEILKQAGLDYGIEKRPAFDREDDGTETFTGFYTLKNTKTGKYLHTVREGYVVTQPAEILDIVLQGIEPFGKQLAFHTGYDIGGGKKMSLQLKIADDGDVKGDVIKRYINLLDSNDGTAAFSFGIGDKTMSCQNQFWYFYKRGIAKFRHTASAQEKIQQIPEMVKTALKLSQNQIELYNTLADRTATKKHMDTVITEVMKTIAPTFKGQEEASVRAKNIMQRVTDNINREVAEKGMNLWGLHSGITRFTTHDYRPSDSEEGGGGLSHLIFGKGYNVNHASLRTVTGIAGLIY